jgi:hypothetical protein
MKSVRFRSLFLLLVLGLVLACLGTLNLTVLYDYAQDLQPDDRVLWQEQKIGKVQSITRNPKGRTAVRLQIKRDFQQMVTANSRFLIRDDEQRKGHQSVEMILLAEGGNPLPDGAEVEGSTYFSLQLERGKRGLKAWSELMQQELGRWEQELSQLPEKEWYKELEREMEYWAGELGQASAETRRYFREQVLPRLEEAVRQLRKRLRELGRGEQDVEILEIKLDELKRI